MVNFNSPGFFLLVGFFFILYQNTHRLNLRRWYFALFNLILFALMFYFKKKQAISLFTFLTLSLLIIDLIRRNQRWRKPLALFWAVLSILFLFIFKYQFFQDAAVMLFPGIASLFKPLGFVGLSFFTFRLVSLIVDISDEPEQEYDPLTCLSYLTFFPCWISGPLDRYGRFAQDFKTAARLKPSQTYQAVRRIIFGCFKKIVIADMLLPFSLDSMNGTEVLEFSLLKAFGTLYCYLFVLYFDFSGYSDIAIGISRLFGIQTPENFSNPLFSRNIQEFWNRWHITLTEWLRDYLFYPILRLLTPMGLGNPAVPTCVTFFITFFLAGIWHGDGLQYIYYGIYHGLLFMGWYLYKLILEKTLSRSLLICYQKSIPIKVAAVFLTFHFICLGLVLFINQLEWFRAVWKGIFS